MRKPSPSIVTRTLEPEARELPLRAPEAPPAPLPLLKHRSADRIKDALLRWLEEEM